MNVLLISQSIVNAGGESGGTGPSGQGRNLDYIASSFGNERRCWEPEWTNQTALLYRIDRGNIRIQAALLHTLSGVGLIRIVGYLIKSLCRCAWSRFDFFEAERCFISYERRLPAPRRILSVQRKRQSTRQIWNRAHKG